VTTSGVNGSPAIRLEDVSVVYRRALNPPTSMKEYFIRALRGGLSSATRRALYGVTLEIRQGEVFGIIGRNGAGKTTLLRVVFGRRRGVSASGGSRRRYSGWVPGSTTS